VLRGDWTSPGPGLDTTRMLIRSIIGSLVLIFVVTLVLSQLPNIASEITDVRTDPASQVGLGCATAAGETSCTLTLAADHAFPDTSAMTVTETAPGSADRTSSTTVQTDRSMITIAGLSESTSYTFNVDYAVVAPDVDAGLNAFLTFMPFIVGVGAVVLVVAAVVIGFGLYLARRR